MLTSQQIGELKSYLSPANQEYNRVFPGDSDQRQPVHTVYGGAQLFKHDIAKKMGASALGALMKHAPDGEALARIFAFGELGKFGVQGGVDVATVHSRVVEKLKREAVEDFRIDFEDGYGNRPDEEEDGHAVSTARELARGMKEGTLPSTIGIRIKPLNDELFVRSLRTMDLFISTVLEQTGGRLPQNFVVTLPKITVVEQVTTLVRVFDALEAAHGLKPGTLKMEFMVETPATIFAPNGRVALPSLVEAARGRCVAAHFGTYDYTASCNITAAHQHMNHPACDHAKHVMQVALAGRGLMLSDGATNVMPVGGSADVVERAWRLSYQHIRHSLEGGFYQGWDLHPAQLPVRYVAVYVFFLESLPAATARLKAFMDKAAQATLLGDVFDDAATGQGLLNFFLRGLSSGAISAVEAQATGLTLEEIQGRSFLKILNARKRRS